MHRSTSFMPRAALLMASAFVFSACGAPTGGTGTTASPVATASAIAAASTAASTAPVGSTTGALPFPTRRGAPLEHARYAAAPPFDLPFTFETPGDGWESLHLLGEFFDIVRFDGASRSGPPLRWIAFGHPERIHGDSEVPAAGLTHAEIADTLRARDDLETTEPEPFVLAGLEGVRLDLRARAADTAIFGGPGGNLSLEPSRDARMGIVVVDGEPLLVLVFAPPDELEEAWREAQPVLESVSFDAAGGP